MLDGSWVSQPGLFAWDRLDPGTALLLEHLPPRLGEVVIDAGAGWGQLARPLADKLGEGVLHLLEADGRALACAVQNVPSTETVRVEPHWCDAGAPWPVRRASYVLSNPPFHQGSRTDSSMIQGWLASAWDALLPGGRIRLVANVHLPYEKPMSDLFGNVQTRGLVARLQDPRERPDVAAELSRPRRRPHTRSCSSRSQRYVSPLT